MSKPLTIHTFEAMLDLLETKPLRAALLAKRNSVTLTRLKYETSAIAYGVALKLCNDDELRADFYADEFWLNRDYRRNPEHLLAHVHMYVYGSHQGSEAKRARAHAAALAPFFNNDRPMKPVDLPDFMEENGGFTGLAALNTPDDDDDDEEEKPDPAQAEGDDDDDDEQDVAEGYDDRPGQAKPKTVAAPVVGNSVTGAAKEPASKKAALPRQDDLKGMKRDDIADHLLLEWTSVQRKKLMNVEVGTEVVATITRLHDNKDGFAVFELTELEL